ncbi:MAG: VWA domain-containing protein [Deltaproteobacteria bacterium]|nr:VWA domain-containing protein [Deltaproteobacteria bacterium]
MQPKTSIAQLLALAVRAACLMTALPIILSAVLLSVPALADQRPLKNTPTEKIDAVLLLDSSGSMRLTDPNRLRDEGVKLFLQFLKPGDRIAVIEFSAQPKVVRPMSDFNTELIKSVSQQIAKIDNSGVYTDLASAIKSAKQLLEHNSRSDAKQVIVLLSDGKMDPDPAKGGIQLLNNELFNGDLPELKSRSVKVHTLAFSDQADREALSQMAAATEGLSMFAPTADKIHESFASLFLAVKKPQVLPLTSKGFKIDGDVQEATFYINKQSGEELTIQTPSGQKLFAGLSEGNVRWFKGQNFDVVTIKTPESGDWKVSGLPSSDSFATVLTNLKLATDWESTIIADESILLQARLYEDEKPVVLPEMTGAVTYAFQITPTDKVSEPVVRETLHDDGKNGDKIKDDGIFSAVVKLKDPGEYALKIVAHAPTFDRYQHIPFRVKPRLISLGVEQSAAAPDAADGHPHKGDKHMDTQAAGTHEPESHSGEHSEQDGHSTEAGSDGEVIVATLGPDAREFKDLDVKLIAVDRDRTRVEIEMQPTADLLRFEVDPALLPKEGYYELEAVLQAQGRGKRKIKASSDKLPYVRKALEGEGPVVTVVGRKPQKEEPVETSPGVLFPLLIVTVMNLIAGGLVFMLMQKAGAGPAVALPQFGSLEAAHQALALLREKASHTEVDLSNPVFLSRPVHQAGSDLTAVSSPQEEAESAAEQEAEPASEQEAEPAEQQEASTEEGGEDSEQATTGQAAS